MYHQYACGIAPLKQYSEFSQSRQIIFHNKLLQRLNFTPGRAVFAFKFSLLWIESELVYPFPWPLVMLNM